MPEVFEASISNSVIWYSRHWIPCIYHILNTCMKKAIQNEYVKRSDISRNLSLVKSIVSLVKHATLCDEMDDGFHLFQELPTRFNSTYNIVECLKKLKYHFILFYIKWMETLSTKFWNISANFKKDQNWCFYRQSSTFCNINMSFMSSSRTNSSWKRVYAYAYSCFTVDTGYQGQTKALFIWNLSSNRFTTTSWAYDTHGYYHIPFS